MNTARYCLQCDDGTRLVHGVKDLTNTVNGVSFTALQVSGWHCPVCAEVEFDAGEGLRYSAALATANRVAVAQRAEELRALRKKLGLSQAEAGKLFGGGVSAFSEYERGKTQPHRSVLLLMRLLGKHPALLNELEQTS